MRPANKDDTVETIVFSLAAMAPVISGVYVGKRSGRLAGIATGVAVFIAAVVLLVVAGYGY